MDEAQQHAKIFVEHGQPISFYMRPCAQRRQLRPLIVERGGDMGVKEGPTSILLTEAGTKVERYGYINSIYIYDCVDAGRLLPFKKYQIQPNVLVVDPPETHKKDSTAPNNEYIAKENEQPNVLVENRPKTRKQVSTAPALKNEYIAKGRSPFTIKDDVAILKYIIDKKQYTNMFLTNLYKNMVKDKLLPRTWQALRERFRRQIVTNLESYNACNLPEKGLLKVAHYCKHRTPLRSTAMFESSFTTKSTVKNIRKGSLEIKWNDGKKSNNKSQKRKTRSSVAEAINGNRRSSSPSFSEDSDDNTKKKDKVSRPNIRQLWDIRNHKDTYLSLSPYSSSSESSRSSSPSLLAKSKPISKNGTKKQLPSCSNSVDKEVSCVVTKLPSSMIPRKNCSLPLSKATKKTVMYAKQKTRKGYSLDASRIRETRSASSIRTKNLRRSAPADPDVTSPLKQINSSRRTITEYNFDYTSTKAPTGDNPSSEVVSNSEEEDVPTEDEILFRRILLSQINIPTKMPSPAMSPGRKNSSCVSQEGVSEKRHLRSGRVSKTAVLSVHSNGSSSKMNDAVESRINQSARVASPKNHSRKENIDVDANSGECDLSSFTRLWQLPQGGDSPNSCREDETNFDNERDIAQSLAQEFNCPMSQINHLIYVTSANLVNIRHFLDTGTRINPRIPFWTAEDTRILSRPNRSEQDYLYLCNKYTNIEVVRRIIFLSDRDISQFDREISSLET